MNLSKIVDQITHNKKQNKTFLIAIDGFGGSGKTTLAKKLAEKFEFVSIVQLDDFYSPELKRTDRKRLVEQVVIPLKENRKAKYQRYDWTNKSLAEWKEIEAGGIVIVEGISTLHPDFGDKYDLTIWIDTSQEEAAKRGISRDINEYNIDSKEQWKNEWMPQEKEYVELIKPQNKADIIFKKD